ncbi:hypothetical protein [Microvirga sp. G4-2]|uniref:hypothetical protein n=1 Tax=Microvirga sp. G4-2 TaxID=3434467 RepID=UPI004044E6C1
MSPITALSLVVTFLRAVRVPARLHMPHVPFHELSHTSKSLLNLRTIRHILGRKLVLAQPANEIRPELELPNPDLEQALAVRTGQIDPCAPMILEHAASSVQGSSDSPEAWQ